MSDKAALEEALIAIDGCVNTLIMARMIVLKALNTEEEPVTQPEVNECPHEALSDAGGGVYVCDKCGEGFK